MKLLNIEKVRDGKYLNNYELTYLNKADKEKRYGMVSHKKDLDLSSLGNKVSGISIVAFRGQEILLLREFRMAVNKEIINFCAGMKEEDETIEACIERELYEETGLKIKKIHKILPPSYAAVSLSDIKNQIAIVEVEGDIEEHGSANEQIKAGFYSHDECKKLLDTEEFSSRCQIFTYFFSEHFFDSILK